VELAREAPALVLLGRYQLLREPRLLREQARVLARPHGEVAEDGGARHVDPLERALALEPQDAELVVAVPERHLEPVPARRPLCRGLARQLGPRAEEPLGFAPGLLEHLVGRCRRDRPHRLDEQLQEVRLGRGSEPF